MRPMSNSWSAGCGKAPFHAVLLAHDEVYDAGGRKLKFGSFYVPNHYLLTVCRSHPELLPAVSVHPGGRTPLRNWIAVSNPGP